MAIVMVSSEMPELLSLCDRIMVVHEGRIVYETERENATQDTLRMSDYGFERSECMALAKGARSMQGGLFAANPCEMTDEDCASVFERAYR